MEVRGVIPKLTDIGWQNQYFLTRKAQGYSEFPGELRAKVNRDNFDVIRPGQVSIR